MRFWGEKYYFYAAALCGGENAENYIFNLKKLIKTQENYLTISWRYIIIYKHCD